MFASDRTREWAELRGLALSYLAETASTNDNAKAAATRETEDFVLYLSAHQTAGRGRGDHHWLDTGAGECLLSTWSFQVASPPQPITAPRVGLSLFRAARRTWPSLAWSLKAPNDLFLNAIKVGGLLIESVSAGDRHRVLVGLGLNVSNHPRRLVEATHLSEALGRAVEDDEWFRFLDELRAQLDLAVMDCQRTELSGAVCLDLKNALNANAARAFAVESVSPLGDLVHRGGIVRWTEL